jgi:hypothetical protein
MPTIVITGASDDLIEIDGDIREEFGHNDDDNPAFLAVSDGTLLRVQRDNYGVWRIVPQRTGPRSSINHVFGPDDRDHTDRLTLTGDDVHWVVYGTTWASRP